MSTKQTDRVEASGTNPNFSNLYSSFTYENKKDVESQDDIRKQQAYRSFFDFKNHGTLTANLLTAIKKDVLQAVTKHGSSKDVLFVFSPSSRMSNTPKRWHEVKEVLDKLHLPSSFTAVEATRDLPFKKNHVTLAAEFDRLKYNPTELKDKFVIILDDVVKSGRHIDSIRKGVMQNGAVGTAAVSLCAKERLQSYGLYQQNKLVPMETDVSIHKALRDYRTMREEEVQRSLFDDDRPYQKVNNNSKTNINMPDQDLQIKKQAIAEISHNDAYLKMPDNVFQQSLNKMESQFDSTLKGLYERKLNELKAASQGVAPKQPQQATAQAPEQKVSVNEAAAPAQQPKEAPVKETSDEFDFFKQDAQPAPQQNSQQKDQSWSIPKRVFIAYCDEKKVTNSKGEAVDTNLPQFKASVNVKQLFNNPAVRTIKDTGYQYVDLSIQPANNPNWASKYQVTTSVQNAPCKYDGRDCRFSDRNALMNIRIDLNALKETIDNKLDGASIVNLTFGQNCGRHGICLDKDKYKQLTNYEVKGKCEPNNIFETTLKSQQNKMGESFGEFTYRKNTLGDAYGGCYSDKPDYKNMAMFNMVLNVDKIMDLPECDKFGNVSIAVVRNPIDRTKPFEEDARGNAFQLSLDGRKMPNFSIVANPKVYQDGRPDPNIVAVYTMKKDDLTSCPTLKNNFTDKDGVQQTKDIIKLSTSMFDSVRVNKAAYANAGVDVPEKEITASRTNYKQEFAQQDYNTWRASHPVPSEEERARLDTLPSQYDACKNAVAQIMEQHQARQQSRSQAAEPLITLPDGMDTQQSQTQHKGMGI